MKQTTEIKEKLSQYGIQALSDSELIKSIGYKGTDFYNSFEFKACKELVRRYERPKLLKITSSKDCLPLFSFLADLDHEQFHVAFLNRNNRVINTAFISKGNATGTVVNVQSIIKGALDDKAQALILCHNHPSGNKQPSTADLSITKQIKDAAKLFDITLLDHIIIAGSEYYSFADEGII